MKHLINRFHKWQDWRHYTNISPIKKVLVLLGLSHYDTFDNWRYYGR